MKKIIPLLVILACSSTPVFAALKQHTVTYDHSTDTVSCDGVSGCALLSVERGDVVVVSITNTVPTLFDYGIEQELLPARGLAKSVFDDIVNRIKVPVAPPPQPGVPAPSPTTLAGVYVAYVDAARAFQRSLGTPGFPNYTASLDALISARSALLTKANAATAQDVLGQLTVETVPLGVSGDEFVATFDAITKVIQAATPTLTNGPTQTFIYDAQDFKIKISAKAKTDFTFVTTPPREKIVTATLSDSFDIGMSSGLAISGLVDDVYTIKTVTDTAEDGTTSERRTAVLEEQDTSASPEAAMFIHITPLGADFTRDWSSWARTVFPRQLTLGLGLNSDVAARVYAGLSWKFGDVASLTAGVAGGRVKRLSNNVNRDDLGDVDPQASRRDIFRGSYFVGLSWRILE